LLWDSKSTYSGENYLKEQLDIAQSKEYQQLNNILVKLTGDQGGIVNNVTVKNDINVEGTTKEEADKKEPT